MSMLRAFSLLLHQAFEFGDQSLVTFFVVQLVRQNDLALAVDGHPVLGIGKIFRGEPEIEREICHHFERKSRGYCWRARSAAFARRACTRRGFAPSGSPNLSSRRRNRLPRGSSET